MKGVALVIATLSIGVLTACGGDNDNNKQPSAFNYAHGYYGGNTTNNQDMVAIVREDGPFWIVYGSDITKPAGLIAGKGSGNGSVESGTFTSVDAIRYDFGKQATSKERLDTSYWYKDCLCGTSTDTASSEVTLQFAANHSAVHDEKPLLSSLAGAYTGRAQSLKDSQSALMVIGADGSLRVTEANSCTITGTVKPREIGNVYDVTLSAGAAPCATPGVALNGAAVLDNGRLLVTTVDASRNAALVLTGAAQS